ncbi:MAG TPA: GNAT family N-acetyltransferase [Actinomycetota bacterium]|nr:GNAT family N-acetyltransferase [Actinomycetota bacterium]
MTDVEIGPADESHLDHIVRLQLELGRHHHTLDVENPRYLIAEKDWRAQIEASLRDRSSQFLVAKFKDEVCGFVRVTMVEKPWGWSCEMDALVVAEPVRDRGIGALLVEAAERIARSMGARAMRANVLLSNLRGREFYSTSGYAEIAVRFGKSLEESPNE